ncbi:A disintegrin and metalloproteinase with thrombospondin motifs 19 [Saguinus oedipus]|uniref:A disintegrin and metalloproteinase with thrombospondin motifs 19 n=1 Tax=Saguinus oedipus TaxID=9490 RepID=A0ABQ9W9K0_SAGOE|nr:A disintegrin and metalloproteinase with thrombospondin motifs 19 [Saguinus oedipus]
MGKNREMRLTHICCCCLLYQLGFLLNGIVSAIVAEIANVRVGRAGATGALRAGLKLQFAPDREEWEVVFPALWRREPVDAAGGSGGSADSGWVRSVGGGGSARAQAASSSREVRSVAPVPLEEPTEVRSESRLRPLAPSEGEEDEELESQELPRGSSGAAALSPGAPASWQRPPPPQPPPSPPPAQLADPDGDEVLLRIPAFSRDLYLLLRRDGRFLAPRFAVEQRPNPGPGPTGAASAPHPPAQDDAGCFYTGAVLRHPGSLASFSTCGGGLQAIEEIHKKLHGSNLLIWSKSNSSG